MSETFDPYYKWLGIPPKEQPPNHYRLLAINLFESDPDVIEAAADRQMSHLRSYQTGKHSAESQKLLNECAAARVTLLNPQKKAEYDRQLREKMAIGRTSPPSVGNALGGVPAADGVSPRSLPRARALPQPQPSQAATPAPLIDVGASSPVGRFSTHRRKKKPAWLIATAGVGGAIAIAVVMWIALRPSGPSDLKNRQLKTAATNNRKTTVADSTPKRSASTAVNEPAPAPPSVAPTPPASSDSALADNGAPGGGISTAIDVADSHHRDNGEHWDLVLAPGVKMRLVKIPASDDGKIKPFYLGQTWNMRRW